MTAIPALGSAFQASALSPKQNPFAGADSASFAALLDEPVQAPVQKPMPYHFEVQALVNTRKDTRIAQEAGAVFPQVVVSAADISVPPQNESASKIETLAASVSTALPARFADTSDLNPVNIPGFHARKLPRLFAFTELGMFGCHGAQFEAVTMHGVARANETVLSPTIIPVAQRDPANSGAGQAFSENYASGQKPVAQTRQESNAEIMPPVADSQMPVQQPAGNTLENNDVLLERSPSTEIRTTSSVLPAANTEPATPPFESEALSIEEGGAPSLPPEIPESRAPSPLSLVVTGPDNALTIIARSNDAGADPAHLRRLAESTAAEFGMHVTEIHINGSAVEPSFSPASGGNDGRRAR